MAIEMGRVQSDTELACWEDFKRWTEKYNQTPTPEYFRLFRSGWIARDEQLQRKIRGLERG